MNTGYLMTGEKGDPEMKMKLLVVLVVALIVAPVVFLLCCKDSSPANYGAAVQKLEQQAIVYDEDLR